MVSCCGGSWILSILSRSPGIAALEDEILKSKGDLVDPEDAANRDFARLAAEKSYCGNSVGVSCLGFS